MSVRYSVNSDEATRACTGYHLVFLKLMTISGTNFHMLHLQNEWALSKTLHYHPTYIDLNLLLYLKLLVLFELISSSTENYICQIYLFKKN